MITLLKPLTFNLKVNRREWIETCEKLINNMANI